MTAGYYDTSYPPSLWAPPAPPGKMQVAPGAVVTNPVIAAMPPAEQLAAINNAYEGNPLTAWTTGQQATVATRVVSWTGAAFQDGPIAAAEPAAEPEPEPEPEPAGGDDYA